LPLGVGQQEIHWLGQGEAEGVVPYTIWSGRDDGASRRREAPAKLSGRWKQTPPPCRNRHHHGGRRRRGSRTVGINEREQPSRRAEEGAASFNSPSPPRSAKRGKAMNQLLLRTTPPRHHGRSGEAQRSSTLCDGEAGDAIGLLERCWSATPWLASPEKLDHGGGNPKLRSG
jgi:hypothetical protein